MPTGEILVDDRVVCRFVFEIAPEVIDRPHDRAEHEQDADRVEDDVALFALSEPLAPVE